MEARLFINNGHKYVLVPSNNRVPIANFMGTCMALAGVLQAGETIEQFIQRKQASSERHCKENKKMLTVLAQTKYRKRQLSSKTDSHEQ